MKKKKIWRGLGQLGLQTIPVIIGVYLGLVANDFSQNRKESQITQSMKEKLWYEIEANYRYLLEVIDYHQFLLDTSIILLEKSNIDSLQKPDFWQGFKTKRLNESAYQASLLTGALANFEIDELEIISKIYTEQANYNLFISQVIINFSNKNVNDPEALVEILTFINISITDIFYIERDLIANYRQAMDLLTIKN